MQYFSFRENKKIIKKGVQGKSALNITDRTRELACLFCFFQDMFNYFHNNRGLLPSTSSTLNHPNLQKYLLII